MNAKISNLSNRIVLVIAVTMVSALCAFGQTSNTTTSVRPRTVSSGERMKISGVVTKREGDTATVQDINNVDTIVKISDSTRIEERKSNPFRGSKKYNSSTIVRGLNVDVEGRGDDSGRLVAERIRFSEDELKVARTIQSRVDPVEGRVGAAEQRVSQVEQNAQRLSGQIDELAAVSNAAKGGAKAAQEAADRAQAAADRAQNAAEGAVAGVNSTNDRISALDDYVLQETTSVVFKVNSAKLSPDAKTELDAVASKALTAKGYVIEVAGYTDTTGSIEKNRALSQQRAEAVVRYLAVEHKIPLRRIINPYGFGAAEAVADNKTREGRAKNRRVDVKILVNRGLLQQAPGTSGPTAVKSN